jgi:hypothetical protein
MGHCGANRHLNPADQTCVTIALLGFVREVPAFNPGHVQAMLAEATCFFLDVYLFYFIGFEVLTVMVLDEARATCPHTGFLLRLFFDPEYGGDMFLRNVG